MNQELISYCVRYQVPDTPSKCFANFLGELCEVLSVFLYLCKPKLNFNHKQNNTMKQKEYKKPTMQVVELMHRSAILAGSVNDGQESLQDYKWHEEEE